MTWHPILAAREVGPGRWYMISELDHPYGLIVLVRRGDERGYRADRTEKDGAVTERVGYYRSLKAATWHVHAAFLRSHGAPPRSSYSA